MNTNKIATGSVNRKLLAALAVLAVAFVVLAAVPAVATDSDAIDANSTVYVDPTYKGTTASDGTQAAPYTTVYDALKAIGTTAGCTVTLVNDSKEASFTIGAEGKSAHGTVTSGNQSVTIDLNGKTLTISEPGVGSSETYQTQGIRILKGSILTIKNGTIDLAVQTGDHKIAQLIHNYGTLTLTDVKVDGSNVVAGTANEYDQNGAKKAMTLQSDNGQVTIDGSTSLIQPVVSSDILSYALVVDWWNNTNYSSGSQITVNTTGTIGAVELVRDDPGYGVASASTLTLTKGTFTGGIEVYGGDTIPSSSNAVLGEFSGKLTVNGTVSVDVTFMGQNNDLTVTSDGSYSGKVSYTDQQGVTSSAVFSKLKGSTNSAIITSGPLTAGSLIIKNAVLDTNGTITVSSGTVELASDLAVASGQTLTVASGATLKVQSAATLSGQANPKNIVNNGRIDVVAGANAVTTLKAYVSGNAPVATFAVAYNQTNSGSTLSTAKTDAAVFGSASYASAGETVYVDVLSVEAGYKIQGITVTSTSDNQFTAFTATEKDGNFYFVMPAAATNGVTVSANIVGTLSATFYLEYSASDIAVGATIQNLEPGVKYSEIKAMLPAIAVKDGYRIAQWYTDASLATVATFGDTALAAPVKGTDASGSVSFYAGMTPVYTVDYSDVTGQGTVTVSPAQAAFKDIVTVNVAAADGWEYSDIKVTYTDAQGKTQTIGTTAVTASAKYTFVMPETSVSVAVTFLEKFDLTIPADKDAPYATITINKVGKTDQTSNASTTTAKATASAVKGTKITFTVGEVTKPTGATATYIVKEFVFTGADNKKVPVSVSSTDTANQYTFRMPGQDVTLTIEYGPSQTLTMSSVSTGGSTVAKSDSTTVKSDTSGDKTGQIAVGAEVVVTATPTAQKTSADQLYGLKSIKIFKTGDEKTLVPYTQSGNKYTFTMPDYAVTVATEYAKAYTVSGVAITSAINGGSVDYSETAAAAVVAGNTFSFSIQLRDGYSLKSITATTDATTSTTISITPTGGTQGTYTLAYPYVAAGSSTASIFTYDKETGTVTMLMPEGNVTSVVFAFAATTYYTVTLNAGENGTIVLYEDKDCKTVLEDAQPDVEGFQVESGKTVYVKVAADGDGTIESINATYQDYVEADVNSSGATVPAHYQTTELKLGIVSSLNKNNDKFGIYSFEVIGDTTINATFAKSALQIAKDAANEYIQGVQKSASMSETIVGYTATWASQADADVSVFTIALNAVAAATTVADVNAAQTTFDTNLLAYMKSTSLSYLETAYNNGTAYNGYTLAYADYNTARNAINAVVLDDDKTVQDEVDTIVSAYDKAMNARTSVNPTPTPSTGAATRVTVSIVLIDGVSNVQILGLDGYVPAGTISVTALRETSVGPVPYAITLNITADKVNTESSYQLVPIVSSAYVNAIFAGSASYSSADGSIAATASGITGMTVTAAAAAQTEVAATTEE